MEIFLLCGKKQPSKAGLHIQRESSIKFAIKKTIRPIKQCNLSQKFKNYMIFCFDKDSLFEKLSQTGKLTDFLSFIINKIGVDNVIMKMMVLMIQLGTIILQQLCWWHSMARILVNSKYLFKLLFSNPHATSLLVLYYIIMHLSTNNDDGNDDVTRNNNPDLQQMDPTAGVVDNDSWLQPTVSIDWKFCYII